MISVTGHARIPGNPVLAWWTIGEMEEDKAKLERLIEDVVEEAKKVSLPNKFVGPALLLIKNVPEMVDQVPEPEPEPERA